MSIDNFLPSEERCAEVFRALRWGDKVGRCKYSKMNMSEWLYIARELQENVSINWISKDLAKGTFNYLYPCFSSTTTMEI